MNRFSSIFGQILHLFPRREFFEAVEATRADRGAKGFSCWEQFVAMMFCQLGQAQSLREICGGLASCFGKARHLGIQKAPVSGLAERVLLGVEDGEGSLLGHPRVVRENIDGLRPQVLAAGKPAGDDPDAVQKQRRVRRMMDIGLDGGGIHPDLAAHLDPFAPGVADNLLVDRLPGLFPQRLDVVLENRLAGILPHLQTGETAEGR